MPSIQLKEVNLYYQSTGQGDPVLLIHGLGSSTRDWEGQASGVAKYYRVITLDLRGHGRSDKPPGPYSVAMFASDLAEFMQSLDIAPAHVIGLSLGGFVACQLAVDHGDLVRTLVLVNSVPGLPRNKLQHRLQISWAISLRRLIAKIFGMRILGRVLGKKLFPRLDQVALKRTFIERWAENDKQAYLASLASVSGWTLEHRLDTIMCPTCLISGEHDFIPLALKENYAAQLPDARLVVIPGSGHFTPKDEVKRFNEAVINFLAEQG